MRDKVVFLDAGWLKIALIFNFDTIKWKNEVDIAPETLYQQSVQIK